MWLISRNITSVDEMFKEICVHIKESSNNGIIVPTISIFPPRKFGKPDSFRIWNPQLFQFAGYDADDGSWIGDKANIGFTKVFHDFTSFFLDFIFIPCSFAWNLAGKEKADDLTCCP